MRILICELVDGFNPIPLKNERIIISGMRTEHMFQHSQRVVSKNGCWIPRVYPWGFGDYSCTYGVHLAWVEHARIGFEGS